MTRRLAVGVVVILVTASCGSGTGGEAAPGEDVDRTTTTTLSGEPTIAEWAEPYFIVVDVANLRAWGTDELTREEWDAFEAPAGFFKDSVDNYVMTDSVWLRSPGAERDGPTERQQLNGIEFEHIVDVVEPPTPIDSDGLLGRHRLIKYHRLTWPALDGNWIRLLVSPVGDEYLLVNREPDRVDDYGPLPEGWSHRELPLESDLTLEFRGEISNIRDSIGDLYQGPVDLDD